MELKVGDKVRFLNEKGGGIVTKLVSTSMVHVAIEEGFEIPVMVSDLVKIEPGGAADRFFDRPINVYFPSEQEDAKPSDTRTQYENMNRTREDKKVEKEELPEDDLYTKESKPLYKQSGAGYPEAIWLLWEPHDQNHLILGSLDIILVNNTPYEAIFSLILVEENNFLTGAQYDVVAPYSKFHIETINRDDLEHWSKGIVQVLYHPASGQELLQPLQSKFAVKPTRFYKETSYQEFKLTGSKALVLNLGDIASLRSIPELNAENSTVEPAARQKIEYITPAALIDKHRIASKEAEVDLHISSLRSDYPTMPQNEILLYQLDYFQRMLESAIAFNYEKVIFIHGIGNGVLKNAIADKLKDYENVEMRRASFAKYGYGAVEVHIHRNNS
jgi:hypothetical protein